MGIAITNAFTLLFFDAHFSFISQNKHRVKLTNGSDNLNVNVSTITAV